LQFDARGPLFVSQKGGAFTPNTIQQLLHRLHARAGIIGGRSHSGRRWFATELISKGVDIKVVSVLMGHSSVAMTAQYAEDNPQRLRRIAANLGS
jgi:integrase/recombinase XerD